jgi:spore coat polysaccharide biosynthesis predicted glycosyltransferase SpsG
LFHRTQKEPPHWSEQSRFPQIHKGLEFAILPPWLKRISIEHYQEQLAEDRFAVAISMGGTDAPNRTLQLLKLLGQTRSQLVLYVALGDAYTHSYQDLLVCASENRQEVILLKSNESMWRVLKNVSLVLCAGGLTTYEAAYIGLPTINILQQSEWAYLFEELVQAGACQTIVPVPNHLELAVDRVMKLAHNHPALTQMHLATKELIPEGGSRRIANILSTIPNPAQ